VGLLLSYHAALPSGPAIVMVAGLLYLFSLCVGTRDSLRVLGEAGLDLQIGESLFRASVGCVHLRIGLPFRPER
jgi:hypothetical protein